MLESIFTRSFAHSISPKSIFIKNKYFSQKRPTGPNVIFWDTKGGTRQRNKNNNTTKNKKTRANSEGVAPRGPRVYPLLLCLFVASLCICCFFVYPLLLSLSVAS